LHFSQKLLAFNRLLLPFRVLHHHLMQAINILLRLTFNVLLDLQQSLDVTLLLISSRIEKAICCLVVIDAAGLLLRSVIIVDWESSAHIPHWEEGSLPLSLIDEVIIEPRGF
jgi:hypothetical protein